MTGIDGAFESNVAMSEVLSETNDFFFAGFRIGGVGGR